MTNYYLIFFLLIASPFLLIKKNAPFFRSSVISFFLVCFFNQLPIPDKQIYIELISDKSALFEQGYEIFSSTVFYLLGICFPNNLAYNIFQFINITALFFIMFKYFNLTNTGAACFIGCFAYFYIYALRQSAGTLFLGLAILAVFQKRSLVLVNLLLFAGCMFHLGIIILFPFFNILYFLVKKKKNGDKYILLCLSFFAVILRYSNVNIFEKIQQIFSPFFIIPRFESLSSSTLSEERQIGFAFWFLTLFILISIILNIKKNVCSVELLYFCVYVQILNSLLIYSYASQRLGFFCYWAIPVLLSQKIEPIFSQKYRFIYTFIIITLSFSLGIKSLNPLFRA